jgi:hypothetical protein
MYFSDLQHEFIHQQLHPNSQSIYCYFYQNNLHNQTHHHHHP